MSFYALRPLLAVRRLEPYGCPRPVEFVKLLHLVDNDAPLLADIQALLERKRAAPELGPAPPVPGIDSYIEGELERLESCNPAASAHNDVLPKLNEGFHLCLRSASS